MANVRQFNTPGPGLPSADWSAVSYIGDGTAFFRAFRYVHRTHTIQDILRPGYWNPVPSGKKDQIVALQPWDEISFCVDGPAPCDATRGLLVIDKRPERPGDDVIVGLVYRNKTTRCAVKKAETEGKKEAA